jgi:hypothetical protein
MKATHNPPRVNYIVSHDLNEEDVRKLKESIQEGNIQSKLDMIMHNQSVLNYKLNKILGNQE